MALCIVSIIFGIISLISLVYSIKSRTAEIVALSTLELIFCIVGICYGLSTEPVTYKFPANEYILEYKVVIIGEKCDTTYMLTKIKTD